ncbi:MAG: hypothetical protein IT191_02290 [Microbacteriaceae bacterium]|nr:hypothetical protein [Cryobacterium sp.]MBX3104659.1 hypothetical protein [Cryobacterium sp.]MCC6375829.1 hypothetical protein [Microbacteriaceae bacterium]
MLPLVLAAVEERAPLIMPNWAFPLTAFIVFTVLGVITWSFRDVANRHGGRAHSDRNEHSGH